MGEIEKQVQLLARRVCRCVYCQGAGNYRGGSYREGEQWSVMGGGSSSERDKGWAGCVGQTLPGLELVQKVKNMYFVSHVPKMAALPNDPTNKVF